MATEPAALVAPLDLDMDARHQRITVQVPTLSIVAACPAPAAVSPPRDPLRDIRVLVAQLRGAVEHASIQATASEALTRSTPAKASRVDVARHMADRLAGCLARDHHKLKAAAGQAALNPTQYTVASLLLARAPGNRWPSMSLKELARLACTSESSVKKAIQELEGRELLKRVLEPGRPSAFDLTGLVDQLEELLHAEAPV